MPINSSTNPWLHRFALLTAAATLFLIAVGGLVTSKGAGMAVPDWPTSYGYNMFALPIHLWTGGALYEHTHRLWASVVGLLVVALTRWLGGAASRKPLVIVGALELLAGFAVVLLWPKLKGTGFFLSGIGGVVLGAALVWVNNAPASKTLVRLGWIVFVLVQFQGLLGGLRVVLFKDQIGIFHAALAQVFFVLLCAIALFTSRMWRRASTPAMSRRMGTGGNDPEVGTDFLAQTNSPSPVARAIVPQSALKIAVVFTTILIFLQLLIGATMRHQHAGLAVWDFPLAHGKLWPDTDSESILRYNQQRVEVASANPITAFQIHLHMVHRVMAMVIFGAVAYCAWIVCRMFGARHLLSKWTLGWFGLILVQLGLGIATVLTHKAADMATAHVVVGVLSLATGAMLCIFSVRSLVPETRASFLSDDADNRFGGNEMAGSAQR
jgi:heme a synthase